MIFAYGDCQPGSFCPADVDGDFKVNFDDILEIDFAFCGTGPCCSGCEESFSNGGPPTQEELLLFIIEHSDSVELIMEAIVYFSQQGYES